MEWFPIALSEGQALEITYADTILAIQGIAGAVEPARPLRFRGRISAPQPRIQERLRPDATWNCPRNTRRGRRALSSRPAVGAELLSKIPSFQ